MKIDRIGETNTANNGLKMTIINYKNSKNVDIQFEDGIIVCHKNYNNFLNGAIEHPVLETRCAKNASDRIGETNNASNGEKITIIEYFGRKNITVQFEDGTILHNCDYSKFKAGKIFKPIDYQLRLNETNKASNGQIIKIVAYRSATDIDVEFEDKTIVNTTYRSFKIGYVKNPNYEKPKKEKIKKEVLKKTPNSKKVKPVKVKKKTELEIFKEKRIGEKKINTNGEMMTIIAYNKSRDISVQFDDGTIVEHVKYDNFKIGKINKNKKVLKPIKTAIGEEVTATNGQKMKIIEAKTYVNITVQFEDGTIVPNRQYRYFKIGQIKNPTLNPPKPKKVPKPKIDYKVLRTGEENIAVNGQKMKIIVYRTATDIDVEFEDGYIAEHKHYSRFKKGSIGNPNFKSRVGTSVNETTLLYYFKNIGFSKKCVNKDTEYGVYEYDLFNKDLMLAIEYDGDPRTHTKEKDERKNNDAEAHGVTIWRVRVPDVPSFEDDRNIIFNLKSSWLFTKEFEETMESIINKINEIYGTTYKIDIDLKRDKNDILLFLKSNYYMKTNDRIGETNMAGNGQKVTIIDYITNGNISVQFEDGTIVENVRYGDFKLGNIANPNFSTRAYLHAKERIGETRIANNGHEMKIVAYRHCHDIDVEFDNGIVVSHVGYNNFTRGNIGYGKCIK